MGRFTVLHEQMKREGKKKPMVSDEQWQTLVQEHTQANIKISRYEFTLEEIYRNTESTDKPLSADQYEFKLQLIHRMIGHLLGK